MFKFYSLATLDGTYTYYTEYLNSAPLETKEKL